MKPACSSRRSTSTARRNTARAWAFSAIAVRSSMGVWSKTFEARNRGDAMDIPNDIFTETDDVDTETLGRLGPLRRLAGIWEGQRGIDINPKAVGPDTRHYRSEENTSELQSIMRITYAVFC